MVIVNQQYIVSRYITVRYNVRAGMIIDLNDYYTWLLILCVIDVIAMLKVFNNELLKIVEK